MVKIFLRDRESIQEAVRRFRKIVERSGLKKEMRKREVYEKPSVTKRRAKLARSTGQNAAKAVNIRKIVLNFGSLSRNPS